MNVTSKIRSKVMASGRIHRVQRLLPPSCTPGYFYPFIGRMALPARRKLASSDGPAPPLPPASLCKGQTLRPGLSSCRRLDLPTRSWRGRGWGSGFRRSLHMGALEGRGKDGSKVPAASSGLGEPRSPAPPAPLPARALLRRGERARGGEADQVPDSATSQLGRPGPRHPASRSRPVVPPPLDAFGALETSASCPHPALGSCFPRLCSPPSCVLSPPGSAILAKPQPLAIARAHPAPGQPRRGRDPPRGPPAARAPPALPALSPAQPRRPDPSPGREVGARRDALARAVPGWPRAPGGAAGSAAGGRKRQPDRSPRARLQIAAVSNPCPASLPAFRTFGIFSSFFLPSSPLPGGPFLHPPPFPCTHHTPSHAASRGQETSAEVQGPRSRIITKTKLGLIEHILCALTESFKGGHP